ncbi:MAG: carboxypeptidase regulatory-like domain-containing protein [Planctomycetes bacterium]|nr:carboxypeptidase regulatory-like domain-containing protein [Planctomycetota bacterium]
MRSSIVLLLLALLGGIAAMLWQSAADAPPPPALADAAPPPATTPAAAAADPVLGPLAAAADEAPDEPADERTAADADPGPDAAEARTALVVRGEPPVPVPDVEVLFVDERDAGARLQGLPVAPLRPEWPELWGQRVRTDAAGRAALPGPRGTLLVAARSGDEFAFATLRPGRPQVTLVLAADEQVDVRVVAADGRPAAAAPIAVLQSLGKDSAEVLWQGDADHDGRVLLRHFQVHRRAAKPPPEVEAFAVLARLPASPPIHALFPGRPAGREPVLLRLPPMATLTVELTDHHGAPLLSPAWVAVRLEGPTEGKAPFAFPDHLLLRHAPRPAGRDVVVVPFVTAGRDVRVTAHFECDRKGTSRVLSGLAADRTTTVALPLGPGQVLLAGRALHADLEPLGPTQLPAAVWHGERVLQTGGLHTLADGRFDFVLAARGEPPPFVLLARFELTPMGKPPATAGARAALSTLQGGRRVELGDLVFGALPPLATGVVVDDRGEPIAGVDVRVQGKLATRRGESWQDLPQLATRTDDGGAFELLGELPPGELRLRGDTDRHFAATEPLRLQGQRLRLCLERNGIVRGRVLLPDWLADEAASLTLQPFDEALRETRSRSVPLRRRGGGRFVVEPLHAGRYDAIVRVRNVDRPIAVVADVFVPPGESRDPRLQALDLQQSLFRYRLRAVDAAGQLVPFDGPIQARLSMPDGAIAEAGFRWQRGRSELITPGTQAELVLFGRGFRPQRLVLGPGDHDVYLPSLRPALLQLPGARALCGPERRVRVSVVLEQATGFPETLAGIDQRTGQNFQFARWDLGRSSGAWLEQGDTVEVPLMLSGRYEVLLRVHATGSERSPQASVSLGVHELSVDAASLLPLRIAVDAAALQRALAEVDARQRAAATPPARR